MVFYLFKYEGLNTPTAVYLKKFWYLLFKTKKLQEVKILKVEPSKSQKSWFPERQKGLGWVRREQSFFASVGISKNLNTQETSIKLRCQYRRYWTLGQRPQASRRSSLLNILCPILRKFSQKWGKFHGGRSIWYFASKFAQMLSKMRQIRWG